MMLLWLVSVFVAGIAVGVLGLAAVLHAIGITPHVIAAKSRVKKRAQR